MKPITYRYQRADGSTGTKTAYPTLTRGLCISPLLINPKEWVVAHVRSGAYLGYAFTSPEAALAVANALVDAADWTITAAELLDARDVLETTVAELSEASGGRRVHGEDGLSLALDNGVPA